MNNKQNDLLKWAMKKIKCDEKCKPNCNVIIRPTGPTERLFKSSNRIIIDSS